MKFPQNVLEEIKKHLISEEKRVESRLMSLESQDPFSDPERLNDNAASDTEASEESNHERMEALQKELTSYLEDITQTLARIKKGTYGLCLSCGKMIDTDRLAIKPVAKYCVRCLRLQEKRH
ncbi:hypothetical protein A2Y99_04955 [Candidatus Gottesmanbacteria bacterium RBG_13_37_7]|uniref:Zinc finger DksA/TraR C4-type domain-containing protein n=1 Tax=Candidatus Gottesmanbacteria bacterium RBG_13_37_7 TaxID=1798369 RepID=A0A1F5YGH9_9BACT|nr:MAG: hypothetical protein A2Y99_04955 [Candidatus Gottesmanbacteria bacterium RBG_13_37_7]